VARQSPAPPPLPGKDAPPDWQPGTAFDPRFFPGVYHLKEKPEKFEYEILITSQKLPSADLMVAVAGKQVQGEPQYKEGGKWHFLSDPAILAKATTAGRETRTTHAFRHTKTVTIDLVANKRYYFLLSPVQLGPEAIKYAMDNPSGLTPLLKPGDDTQAWDPTGGIDPFRARHLGPQPDDIARGSITLPVIDPYAWAENIAEKVYPDRLERYAKWLGSIKNTTIEKLKKETSWPSLDHLYVAKLLDSVIKNHPKSSDLLDELKDWRKWSDDLNKWEKDLIQKNADINAAAHHSIVQLIEWLKGPAHTIIDTAILKDTIGDSAVDAVDQGVGILHWSLCTENMLALAPGVAYLKDFLTRPDTILDNLVFKHIQAKNIPTRHQIAFKHSYP
jgi:hypothetical protein